MSATITGVDTRNLNRALAISEGWSKRTPPVMVATAGFFIARQTTRDAHRATMSGIDTSLGVVTTQGVKTRGPNKGKPGRRKIVFPKRVSEQNLTLADRIVMARLQTGSEFNKRTLWRWYIYPGLFSSGGKAAFFAAVRTRAREMISGRHKSIAFIASTARAVVTALAETGLVPSQYRRNAAPDDPEVAKADKFSLTPKGRGAVESSGHAANMRGELLAGVNGEPPNLNDRHNEAMHRWMTGPLQRAINSEEARTAVQNVAHGEMDSLSNQFAATGTKLYE